MSELKIDGDRQSVLQQPATDRVVLYAEDEDATALLFEKSLEETGVGVRLIRVRDGEQALSFLRREGKHSAAPLPHLVILDINMPRIDGFEVLHQIRGSEPLKHLPVVIFTSSRLSNDLRRAYSLGADKVFVKGYDWESFVTTAHSIRSMLPSQNG